MTTFLNRFANYEKLNAERTSGLWIVNKYTSSVAQASAKYISNNSNKYVARCNLNNIQFIAAAPQIFADLVVLKKVADEMRDVLHWWAPDDSDAADAIAHYNKFLEE